MTGRLVWILMNAPLPFLVASAASTLMAPTSACVWMATKPWSAVPIHARLCQVRLIFLIPHLAEFQCLPITPLVLLCCVFIISDEEPFLIMADHHEIRKLSIDGSNYTILKQAGEACTNTIFTIFTG